MKNSPPSPHPAYGNYISHNIKLEPQEILTIKFFLELGEDVEQIPPSNTPHVRRPDFIMQNLAWEMKSPTSSSPKAFTYLFYKSLRQSTNVIFDLRRLKSTDTQIIKLADKLFNNSRTIKNMLIITKKSELLNFHKKR